MIGYLVVLALVIADAARPVGVPARPVPAPPPRPRAAGPAAPAAAPR